MNFFTYKNTKISYLVVGAGNPIVFLHGFLENKNMWNAFAPELSKNNQVICIDLLGHGQSESLGYVHSMETQAQMVFTVLNELKIKKAAFVGHSMGGYIALALAEIYPKMVSSLVLLNSTSYEDSKERKANRDRAIKAVKQNHTTFVRLSIGNLFSVNNRQRLENEIEKVRVEALKTQLQGIIAALEGMKIRKDRFFILQEAKFPITLILGKQDPVLNYEENILQLENTKTKLFTFPDGHMTWIENQEELLVVLKAITK